MRMVSCVKLRPFKGSSTTFSLSTVEATVDVSVCSCKAAALTSTTSVTSPIDKVRSTRSVWFTASCTPVCWDWLKPGISAATE